MKTSSKISLSMFAAGANTLYFGRDIVQLFPADYVNVGVFFVTIVVVISILGFVTASVISMDEGSWNNRKERRMAVLEDVLCPCCYDKLKDSVSGSERTWFQ